MRTLLALVVGLSLLCFSSCGEASAGVSALTNITSKLGGITKIFSALKPDAKVEDVQSQVKEQLDGATASLGELSKMPADKMKAAVSTSKGALTTAIDGLTKVIPEGGKFAAIKDMVMGFVTKLKTTVGL